MNHSSNDRQIGSYINTSANGHAMCSCEFNEKEVMLLIILVLQTIKFKINLKINIFFRKILTGILYLTISSLLYCQANLLIYLSKPSSTFIPADKIIKQKIKETKQTTQHIMPFKALNFRFKVCKCNILLIQLCSANALRNQDRTLNNTFTI